MKFKCAVKIKLNLSPCLMKEHAMDAYLKVDGQLHATATLLLE